MREHRKDNEIRKIEIRKNWSIWADGSAWVKWGNNIIAVTASIENRVPPHLMKTKSGWISAEYRMLPRSTSQRKKRNENRIVPDGRQSEISRLLGRVLRSCVNMEALPKKTIWIDCDVIQADGGTRIASLLGGYIALVEALRHMKNNGLFTSLPLKQRIAGISVAVSDDKILVDPDYSEDSTADVDLNIILNEQGDIVEIQGGAEGKTYSQELLIKVLDEAKAGIEKIFELETELLDD